jgi:glucuronate isomerase
MSSTSKPMEKAQKASNSIKPFMDENFLLNGVFAQRLYHQYAKDLPIIDYHCHLSPKDITENRQFENLTRIWLAGDHYKWRAMRTLGVDEKFITGKASDKEKFMKWAEVVPHTMRNPLYHWTHLELKRYFNIDTLLSPETGEAVYEKATALLQEPSYHTLGLLEKMKVETVCSTDDPIDDLNYHIQAKNQGINPHLFPAFRPDKAYAVEHAESYLSYLDKLGEVSGVEVKKFSDLMEALKRRVDFFHENGGRLSDHGLEKLYYFEKGTFDIEFLFNKIRENQQLSAEEVQYFKFETLSELSKLYHAKGWTQQFHVGALRNTNERMLRILGPDTGFDSIGDFPQSVDLGRYLNYLDSTDQLAKTILYNLNPADNEVMATMIGNFNDGSIKGKVQFGSGWWFLDQKDGMEKQINTLSNMGILSCFIGMITDSRSFLSFPRHEYFRRILCNMIGNDVENGELPADEQWLGKMVSGICYYNAKEYFQF